MNRRIVLLLLFTAALTTMVGCHRGWLCDDGCGPCGSCRPCGDCGPCRPCGDCCDPCGGPCGGRCFRPVAWVLGLFRPIELDGCGCSRNAYCGDFCGDPPDNCDPCDRCGNWTGRSGCSHCGSHYAGPPEGGDEIEGEEVGPAPDPQPAQPHKATRSSQTKTNRTTRTSYNSTRSGYYQ